MSNGWELILDEELLYEFFRLVRRGTFKVLTHYPSYSESSTRIGEGVLAPDVVLLLTYNLQGKTLQRP